MQKRFYDERVALWLAVLVAVVLAVIPFHATLTVWLSKLVGHYTLLRLWKELLLIPLGAGAAYLLFRDKPLRLRLFSSLVFRLITAYLAIQVVWGIAALLLHQVTVEALGYGWVSDTRYLVFFLIVWVIATKTPKLPVWWPKLVFWPAAIVVAFGLMQYFVLPYDFMKHLGYNAATIFPYEDINHNTHYIRIMSSLRGANPLGAYLVVVLSLVVAVLLKYKGKLAVANRNKVAVLSALGTAGGLALILSFSRGAWVGLALSVAFLVWASLWRTAVPGRVFVYGAAAVLVLAIGLLVLRDNSTFQNVFLHTQTHSLVATTSNQDHISASEKGLSDILHEPFGRGPGTAGPASVYNGSHPARIAEDYFLQIGQELGILGLGLFLAINVYVAKELWVRRRETLALGLLAALLGVTVINLLSHAWADDTLAYLWWGLAAVASI